MSYLVDSNILCRLARSDDPQHQSAREAVDSLLANGEELILTPQVEREFWVVATRPRESNGLGMSPTEAGEALNKFSRFFVFKADNNLIHEQWRELVKRYGVSGKEAHDAGHVAAALTHGAALVLTFDVEDFRRYQEVKPKSPQEVKQELSA